MLCYILEGVPKKSAHGQNLVIHEKTVHKILYLIVCFQAQDQTQAEKDF